MATSDDIAAILESLRDSSGTVRPQDVVAVAVDPSHILHDRFEWDDSIAGELYRLDQARELIRSIEVEITIKRTVVTAVGYVHDERLGPRESGYVRTVDVVPFGQGDAVLDREFARIQSAVMRARTLAETFGKQKQFEQRLRALL